DYNSTMGLIKITGRLHLDFGLFSVTIRKTFTIGFFKLPPPVYLGSSSAGRLRGGAVASDGILYLNMGDTGNNLASRRDIGTDELGEKFYVRHISGEPNAGGETVEVSAFGRTQQFTGVKKIIADGGSGDDVIVINQGVLSAVDLSGGDGDDVIAVEGP